MGKIRIRTIGDEEAEKKQAQEAQRRAESKRAEKTATALVQKSDDAKKELSDSDKVSDNLDSVKPVEDTKIRPLSKYAAKKSKAKHSRRYSELSAKVEKNKCGIAFRDAEFPILYNNGISYIDDIGSLIKFLNPKATAKQCEQMLDEFYVDGVFSHKKYEEYKLLAEQEWIKTENRLSERTKRPNKFELLGI